MTSVEQWVSTHGNVSIPLRVFEETVRMLDTKGERILALKMTRVAFKEQDGGYATLPHAREIVACIIDPKAKELLTMP